jgi:hypothetical protein
MGTPTPPQSPAPTTYGSKNAGSTSGVDSGDTSTDPTASSGAPVLSLFALDTLSYQIIDDKTYYLIDEGVSGIDVARLSASDPDTPTSSLFFEIKENVSTDEGYHFVLEDKVLSVIRPFTYSEQGDSYNRYSMSVSVSDYENFDLEEINIQVTYLSQKGDTGNNSFDGFATGYTGIDGGDGVDTVNYDMESKNASFTLNSNNPYLKIKSQTNSDKLSNIERLYFTDKAYALDLDGNAGIAAKVIIASFGASDISTYMKAALSIVDKGTTLDELCDLVISQKYIDSFAGGSDMGTFVEYVYGNVVGRELNAFEKAMMENISTGGSTKAELLKLAVQTDDVASQITTNTIDLIGVAHINDGEKLVISFDV